MTLVTQHFDTLQSEMTRFSKMTEDINRMFRAQAMLLNMRQLGLPEALLAEIAALSDVMTDLQYHVDQELTELAQLRALISTAAIINSSLEWQEVITRAMDLVIGLTGAERGYIMLRDESANKWTVTIARNLDQTTIEDEDFSYSRTIVDKVIRTAQPEVTDNASEEYNMVDSIHRYDLRSIMCVPLVYQQEVSGVIYVDNPGLRGAFGPKEKRLMMAFANQAAIAIKNARLIEEVRAQLQTMAEIRQFLDNVFASIASGVVTTDAVGMVRTINPAAESILGVSTADSIGRPLLSVLPPLYEGFENLLQGVIDEGHTEFTEISTVLPTRGPSFLSLKLSPLRDETDQIMGIAIVLDDLTDLKQREETLNVIQTYLSPEMVDLIDSLDNLGLTGEERVISVVFADVRGFTTYSETLPPEQLLQAINQYLSIGADAIQSYAGIIDKYMGDAIVGLYNTQLNMQEDHALRAVQAAIDMVRWVKELHKHLSPEDHLACGIGVHTDWAMLGNVGSPSRKEFTALGHAVNYAKKLQEIALGHEVIISKQTYEIVSAWIEAEFVERETRSGDAILQGYRVIF